MQTVCSSNQSVQINQDTKLFLGLHFLSHFLPSARLASGFSVAWLHLCTFFVHKMGFIICFKKKTKQILISFCKHMQQLSVVIAVFKINDWILSNLPLRDLITVKGSFVVLCDFTCNNKFYSINPRNIQSVKKTIVPLKISRMQFFFMIY